MKMATDKWLHFLVGGWLGTLGCLVVPWWCALLAVLVAAVAKEVVDHQTHPADVWDAIATCVGGAVGVGVAMLLAGLH